MFQTFVIFCYEVNRVKNVKNLLKAEKQVLAEIFFLRNFIFYHRFESINFISAGILKFF